MNRKPARRGGLKRPYRKLSGLSVCAVLLICSGCATVAPKDQAILADPTMQFDAEAKHDAALRHAIENREGSIGGSGATGGGCGCN